MARPRATIVAALALGGASCGQLPIESATSASPIFGGTADTTDNAVMVSFTR